MVSDIDYKRYVERMDSIIRDTLHEMECQPIFFIGSGLSKRYLGTPSWLELLELAAKYMDISHEKYNYILQKNKNDPILIADNLTDFAFEWAWTEKSKIFSEDLYLPKNEKSIFMKTIICEIIKEAFSTKIDDALKIDEINLLRNTNPHAIITTNYDDLLETVFQGYEPVVGEKVIKYNLNLIGEIFKIHGTVSDSNSITINSNDYLDYKIRKKYISAKLITYLTEHPVFIFGYGFNDPNVSEIISDVGEIISKDGFIENIFYIKWENDISNMISLPEEYILSDEQNGKQYRVRAISTNDFSWIFKAISQDREMNPINTKTLRALAARTYKLIRKDIPQKSVEVDYKTLESILDADEELPKLLGIVSSHNSNMTHPFTITQLGKHLGYNGWHGARKLIERVAKDKGVNICTSDNRYYCSVKTGEKSRTGKYSKEALTLLSRVSSGEDYEVKIT